MTDETPEPSTSSQAQLVEAWARWSRSRRLFGPEEHTTSILKRLDPPRSKRRRNAACSPLLQALNHAIAAELADERHRLSAFIFKAHHLAPQRQRVADVCLALRISRATYYRHLNDFTARAVARAHKICQPSAGP